MERLRIMGDGKGNTLMVELTTTCLSPSALETIFLYQLHTPDRHILILGTKINIPITPQTMKEIREKSILEQEKIARCVAQEMKKAQHIQIFTTKPTPT